jgi:hypothetical protein
MFYISMSLFNGDYIFTKMENNGDLFRDNDNNEDFKEFEDYKRVKSIFLTGPLQTRVLPKNIFRRFTNVQEINFSDLDGLKEIHKDTFKYNTKLKVFEMTYVGFEDLPVEIFKHNTKLKKIFIKHVNFTTYKKDLLKGLTDLKNLTLGGNYNRKPVVIEQGFFDHVPQVTRLTLYNYGTYISADASDICVKYGADTANGRYFGAMYLYEDEQEYKDKRGK